MTMDCQPESTALSALMTKIASLERKYNKLEERCETLEATKSTTASTPVSTAAGNEQAGGSETEKESPTSRVKVILSKRDQDGQPIESDVKAPAMKDYSAYAFVLKKIMFDNVPPGFDKSELNRSEINVVSQELWDLLKKHLRWYPYHIFSDSRVTLYSPYKPIIFHWDELLKVASQHKEDDNDSDKQAKNDLKLLLDTISGGSSGDDNLDKFFQMRDNYKSQQSNRETVQFRDLWTIFPPGTLIYGKPFPNEDQVFVVKDSNTTWPMRKEESKKYYPWTLVAWSYDRKKGSFGKCAFILSIEFFDGHQPLTSLPFFPFEKHEDYELIRSKLVHRGKTFQEVFNTKDDSRMFEYKGDAIVEMKGFAGMKIDETDNQFESRASELPIRFISRFLPAHHPLNRVKPPSLSHVDGRVMVDYQSFYQYGSHDGRNGSLSQSPSGMECTCSDCQDNEGLAKRYRLHFDMGPKNKDWEDEQYLLCPPRVLGYILAEKQWAQLRVSNLKLIPSRDDQDAWNSRLKLADNETKKLLFDLVKCHVSSETPADGDEHVLSVNDIVPGKGKGLVILLYGPPGVGKTSTAETIAIATRKPLFSISVSDVGTKATHVESNLSKIFSLAAYWKAILLIDEADVFLESRGRGGIVQSMDKNALVSVFLRVLEYYKGIMFLTTNQIAEFDVAIPSRIHVAIKYESLRSDQMEAIFRGFLDSLNKQNLVEDYQEIREWLREDVFSEGLDGRQIRNIVTTALDLAHADMKNGRGRNKLEKSHLKRAFNNTKNFKRDFDTQMQRYKDSQNKMIK
ncbi:hypothetical protein GGS21DRAFT_501824 [Xylaria nigripes]|nr:hypothetical protein GGS21DRAFT_501824 [Xylaria nigripes]